MTKILLPILTVVLFACSHHLHEVKSNFVEVRVQRLTKSDSWIVTYKLPQKVYGVSFSRDRNLFRSENWKVLTPKVEIVKENTKEKFISKEPFNKVVVKFKSYYKHTPKDYEFHQSFSGSGVILYTGHLNVTSSKFDKITNHFFFQTEPSQNIIISGKIFKGAADWTSSQDGTYVYFGNSNFTEYENVLAVFDKGLPDWLQAFTMKQISKLFRFYEDRFNLKLEIKPMVYLNYADKDKKRDFSKGGGTLDGIVQLTIYGREWRERKDEAKGKLFYLLSHESAHLWNSGMHSPAISRESWMHEGSADYFAYKTLLNFKMIDKEKYQSLLQGSLVKCKKGLKGKPVNLSKELKKFRNYYHCGVVLSYLTEKKLIEVKKGDIFAFWSKLFKNSQSNHFQYTQNDYLMLLKFMTGDLKLVNFIEEITSKSSTRLSEITVP